jgi:xanthine dehydrogenase accessory factor
MSESHVHDPACDAAHGDVTLPPDTRRLVLVFDSPVAQELAVLAGRLSWPVTVLDPAAGDTVTAARIDASCDVVVCDHGRPELGDVLAEVLAGPTRWVGVMGSLRHTAPHVEALRERGLAEHDIARVHRPIGLDIGSHTPPEIAVATIAGLLADRNGRPGGPFS